MIAAKYEEIYPPELKDFVYITDSTYQGTQVSFYFFVKLSTCFSIAFLYFYDICFENTDLE